MVWFLLTLGDFAFSQGVTVLYECLVAQAKEKRETGYELFIKEFEKVREWKNTQKEAPQEAMESRWRIIAQQIEEWREENAPVLFNLRLKALIGEVGRKPEEAREAESRLSSAFQALISQWEAPPSSLPPPLPAKEEIVLPPPPALPQFWWKSPILISFVPTLDKGKVEEELRKIGLEISQDIEKEKEVFTKAMVKYERILEEVKRRCPLP